MVKEFIRKYKYYFQTVNMCSESPPNLPFPSLRRIRLSAETGGIFCVLRKVLKYKIEICIIFTI
jgi:hypothetical protein